MTTTADALLRLNTQLHLQSPVLSDSSIGGLRKGFARAERARTCPHLSVLYFAQGPVGPTATVLSSLRNESIFQSSIWVLTVGSCTRKRPSAVVAWCGRTSHGPNLAGLSGSPPHTRLDVYIRAAKPLNFLALLSSRYRVLAQPHRRLAAPPAAPRTSAFQGRL